MPNYRYLAIDKHGASQRGTLSANDLTELEQKLQQQALFLIKARGQRATLPTRIQRQLVTTLFIQLNQLNQAGVPLIDSLNELLLANRKTRLHPIIADLLNSTQQGQTLSQAMSKHPNIFNPVTLALMQVGEESGQLDAALEHISNTLKWQDELRSHTRNLLLYPCFTGCIVLSVSLFLMLYLVPQMAGLLERLGVELPAYTLLLFQLSGFIQHYGIYLLIALLLLCLSLPLLRQLKVFRLMQDQILLQLWGIGPVIRKIILARFANAFALMYQSGINILSCLHFSQGVVNNQIISRAIQQVAERVSDGNSLTHSFEQTALFPSMVTRMLHIGEHSGSLDRSLLEVSAFYERETKDAIKQLQTLLEPCLTLILGLLLGWVMLAVLSPMYSIINSVSLL